MSFPKRTTLPLIHAALIAGYDGTSLTSGDLLTARRKPDLPESISDEVLPFLLFDLGGMTFSDWKEWDWLVSWDVPAKLKVKGEPGEVDDVLMGVIQDLLLRTRSIYGLPINEAGNVVPFSDETAAMFDGDEPKLMFLAERGAPVIKSIGLPLSKGPYAEANIVFGVSSLLNVDPRVLRPMTGAVLGVNPVGPGQLYQDATSPDGRGVRLLIDEDRTAVVNPVYTAARETIRSVNVTPYSAALSAGAPTVQLTAIAFYLNGASTYVMGRATWSSTNAAVATVNSAGLVTRTGAGSCLVSCTFNGASSGSVSIVSS